MTGARTSASSKYDQLASVNVSLIVYFFLSDRNCTSRKQENIQGERRNWWYRLKLATKSSYVHAMTLLVSSNTGQHPVPNMPIGQ